jgi:hypothetical protein
MSEKTILLSPKKCFSFFDQSFNRVKYFSCIAENTQLTHLPTEWVIKTDTGLNYGMQPPEEKQQSYILAGYQHFMQCYLVRDCIESFALCLDEFFLLLLLNGKRIHSSQRPLDALSPDEAKNLRNFNKASVADKIKKLQSTFGITLEENDKNSINSLRDIRNRLAHNNGIVRESDGTAGENGKRLFQWTTMTVFGTGETTGERQNLKKMIGKTLTEDTNFFIEFKPQKKEFTVGEQLYFSAQESYEIARSLEKAALALIQSAEQVMAKP